VPEIVLTKSTVFQRSRRCGRQHAFTVHRKACPWLSAQFDFSLKNLQVFALRSSGTNPYTGSCPLDALQPAKSKAKSIALGRRCLMGTPIPTDTMHFRINLELKPALRRIPHDRSTVIVVMLTFCIGPPATQAHVLSPDQALLAPGAIGSGIRPRGSWVAPPARTDEHLVSCPQLGQLGEKQTCSGPQAS
jgi:hypothetical protein